MARRGTIFEILIASPSDVPAEREAVRRAIEEWNIVHGKSRSCMLHAVAWETHAAPEFGERPQAVLNRQLVDSCDALVGLFATRLGSATGEALSGTVEEIERVHAVGRPVMLYFGRRPVDPDAIDTKQLDALRAFKEWCAQRSLFNEYESLEDLSKKLALGLTRLVERLRSREEPVEAEPGQPIPDDRRKWMQRIKEARDRQANVEVLSPIEEEVRTRNGVVRRDAELAGFIRVEPTHDDSFRLIIPFANLPGPLTTVTVPLGQAENIWFEIDGTLRMILRAPIVGNERGAGLRPRR